MERLTAIILSLIIFVMIVGAGLFIFFRVRTDTLTLTTRESGIMTIHFMFHEEKKLKEGVLVLYGIEKGRLSLLSVPNNVGMLLRNLGRIDSIDTLFDDQNPQDYLLAMEELAEISIPFYISISTPDELIRLVDLLGGISVNEEQRKDGLQVAEDLRVQKITYSDLVRSILLTFQKNPVFFTHPQVRKELLRLLNTNIDKNSFNTLVGYMEMLDRDQVLWRNVEGTIRNVIVNEESKNLLFPFFDGQWMREYVQGLQQILVAEQTIDTKVIRVRVLNGTDTVGLANRTANLLRGFGFTVVEIGNADQNDYANTIILDHSEEQDRGNRIAQVIQAPTITREEPMENIDITLILGRDFDGRYVRQTE